MSVCGGRLSTSALHPIYISTFGLQPSDEGSSCRYGIYIASRSAVLGFVRSVYNGLVSPIIGRVFRACHDEACRSISARLRNRARRGNDVNASDSVSGHSGAKIDRPSVQLTPHCSDPRQLTLFPSTARLVDSTRRDSNRPKSSNQRASTFRVECP